MVPTCLAPGPGMLKEEEYYLLGNVTDTGGLASLHIKDMLLPESLAISKNLQPQRGGLSPVRKIF